MGKKNIRFYFALTMGKAAVLALKMIKRDATYFPGKLAITLCPDFLGRIDKPKTIIGVTGTNGKTTVSNMLVDTLTYLGYDVLNNRLGSNINAGLASSLIHGSTVAGKAKKEMAVLEIDERSSKKIYPYLEPTYLVCTNIFRDSLKRNAHTEFIAHIIGDNIPENTTLVLNGDDLIASNLAKQNKRVYFGIEQLPTDTKESQNIVRDIIICPECDTKLEYDYYRYHHIGKAHCPICGFSSPEIDYLGKKLDFENKTMQVAKKDGTQQEYHIVSDNIINLYNMLATITVLTEMGIESEKIKQAVEKLKIVETRFSQEEVNGKKIVMQLAKGQNPIACSRAFEYVGKQPENKSIILILDDLHEQHECISWYYDSDYEFMNSENIKQIIVGGKRHLDQRVRLEIAGVSPEKIYSKKDELEAIDEFDGQGIDTVYILYDLYSLELLEKVKGKIKSKLEGEVNS